MNIGGSGACVKCEGVEGVGMIDIYFLKLYFLKPITNSDDLVINLKSVHNRVIQFNILLL